MDIDEKREKEKIVPLNGHSLRRRSVLNNTPWNLCEILNPIHLN